MIDIWDIETFDDELLAALEQNRELILSFIETARETELERLASPDDAQLRLRRNLYYDRYGVFLRELSAILESRTIRGWHYTRLTDIEVDRLRSVGIVLSTMATMRYRLDSLVKAAELTGDAAEELISASPLQNKAQLDGRVDRFWLTARPIPIDDGVVNLLLQHWGGEVVYFWLEDYPRLDALVQNIGKGRVIEIAAPIAATKHASRVAEAVTATFSNVDWFMRDFENVDVCLGRGIPADAVVAVHTDGDATFSEIGTTYPVTIRRCS
jgi:hypothetical protein